MAGEEGRSPPRWALVLGLILLIALGIFVSWPEADSAKRPERSQEPVRSPLRSPAPPIPGAPGLEPSQSVGHSNLTEASSGRPQLSTPTPTAMAAASPPSASETPGSEETLAPWLGRHGLGAECGLCAQATPPSQREHLLAALALAEEGHSHRVGAFKVPLSELVSSLRRTGPTRIQFAPREEALALALLVNLHDLTMDFTLPPRIAALVSDPSRALVSSLDTRSAAWRALTLQGLAARESSPEREVWERERALLTARAARGSNLIEQSLGVLAGVPLAAHPKPLTGLRARLSAALARPPLADPEAAYLFLRARLSLSKLSDTELKLAQSLAQALYRGEDSDPCRAPWLSSPGASAVETAAYLQLYLRTVERAGRWR